LKTGDRIPILITAFNRPETLAIQLSHIDSLSRRYVWISIDGPRNESDYSLVQEVIHIAKEWSKVTQHQVSVFQNNVNAGIYQHALHIFPLFFSEFEVGAVLEDDIRFADEFIELLDANFELLMGEDIWSIQGFNPASRNSPTNKFGPPTIKLQPTHVHTIWGWASNAKNVNSFVELVSQISDSKLSNKIISNFAKKITFDPALRLGIKNVWKAKINRFRTGASKGGWDNLWELAGWNSGKFSLVPDFSLSVEVNLNHESQTHRHKQVPDMLKNKPKNLVISTVRSGTAKRNSLSMLQVWGISRKYCWFFIFRLLRQR
jgi:hypothetical protein